MQKIKKIGSVLSIMIVLSLLAASPAAAHPVAAVSAPLEVSFLPPASLESALSQVQNGTAGSLGGGTICNYTLKCYPAATGRWIITYLRTSEGHYVTFCQLYVPDFIDNEADAQKWRWSDEYLADLCSLDDEPQTWQGIYLHVEKEYYLKCPDYITQ